MSDILPFDELTPSFYAFWRAYRPKGARFNILHCIEHTTSIAEMCALIEAENKPLLDVRQVGVHSVRTIIYMLAEHGYVTRGWTKHQLARYKRKKD